jgi:hypothetical protein
MTKRTPTKRSVPATKRAATNKAEVAKLFAKLIAKPARLKAKDIKAPRPGSKREIGLKLLARKQGATIDDIENATGWARGACSSFMGYDVHSQLGYGYRKDDKTGAYHLVMPKGMKSPRFIQYTS